MIEREISLALGLALAASLAQAAPNPSQVWVNVGKNNLGASYDVDRVNAKREGNLVTFALRVQYAPSEAAKGADGFVALRQGNCADRTYSDLHTDYMKKGAVLNSVGPDEKHTARGGSIAAIILDRICAQ